MRHAALLLLVIGLSACADPAQRNINALAAADSVYIQAQQGALQYRALPSCTTTPLPPCRDAATYRKIQEIDARATPAFVQAHAALKADPANAGNAIASAAAVATEYKATVPGGK